MNLKERDQAILQEVIETFLERGEPVSSLRLVRSDRHGLSAATIRAVLAHLEDLGLLHQPHTSAGRVPTPLAYHFFIDSLMRTEGVSEEIRAEIDQTLSGARTSPEEMASEASTLLSRFSSQVGMVLTPDLGGALLRRVEFVALSGRRILCVTVSSSGFIENKVLETDQRFTREELTRFSNYLTDNFRGSSLSEIRERLVEMMDRERDAVDDLLSGAVQLARQGMGMEPNQELVVKGAEALLSRPELHDLDQVRRLFETFSDKARVVTLLNRCLDGPGVRVLIGEENDLTSDLDFSLIVRGYHVAGTRIGTIGVFGPSRMEYQRLIPLVDYLGLRMSRSLDPPN